MDSIAGETMMALAEIVFQVIHIKQNSWKSRK